MYCHIVKNIKSTLSLLILLFLILFVIITNLVYAQSSTTNDYNYDLLVFTGEPEGVMAAISAARNGVDTLLLLKRERPGGLMTYGGLNFLDINQGPDGVNLNKGLFAEWHKKVGGKTTFSINNATSAFENMLSKEENLEIINNVNILETNKDNGNINSLTVETEDEIREIRARYYIDASQDADLAVMGGANYFEGGADIGLPERHMAATLVLHIANVDWQELAKDVKTNKFGPSYINKDNAWGFVEIGELYQAVDKNTKMRGLNIVIEEKAENCEVFINALLVFDFLPADSNSLKLAYERASKEADHVLGFLKKNLSGFKNAKLLSFPEELYVRESRHIVSEYQLKVEDLLNNRVSNDTIALASYPLDYQASNPDYNGFVLFNPDIYGIPLRSIIPKGIGNLFVVGRSSGYSSLAAASARVLPTGMSSAEGAGLVVSYLIKENLQLRDLIDGNKRRTANIFKEIQEKLEIKNIIEKYNAYIDKNIMMNNRDERNKFWGLKNIMTRLFSNNNFTIDPLLDNTVLKNHLEYLTSWGLIIGGYDNDFRLSEEISEKEFAHIIIKGLKQQQSPILYEWVPGGLETMSSNVPLSRDQAAMLLIVAISKPLSKIEESEYFLKAVEYNLIPELISTNIQKNRTLTRAEAYILLSSFLQKYQEPDILKFYRGE